LESLPVENAGGDESEAGASVSLSMDLSGGDVAAIGVINVSIEGVDFFDFKQGFPDVVAEVRVCEILENVFCLKNLSKMDTGFSQIICRADSDEASHGCRGGHFPGFDGGKKVSGLIPVGSNVPGINETTGLADNGSERSIVKIWIDSVESSVF